MIVPKYRSRIDTSLSLPSPAKSDTHNKHETMNVLRTHVNAGNFCHGCVCAHASIHLRMCVFKHQGEGVVGNNRKLRNKK